MKLDLLNVLKCPISKKALEFILISEFEKEYSDNKIIEIKEGVLISEMGFIFPIIDGIPRMLIESIYDYETFLEKNYSDFGKAKILLEKKYHGLLSYCIEKNSKTKNSFEFEWSFFDANKNLTIWHDDIVNLDRVFLKEMGVESTSLKEKTILDVGCGHGVMTSKISQLSKFTLGVELSKSIENAYNSNTCINANYIQGDLQFLPLDSNSFDIVYSSGVIHHTNNTELSLSLIEKIVKPKGIICLWLYHPQKSIIHNFMNKCRIISSAIPLKLLFILLNIFVLPFLFILKFIKKRKFPNYREVMIDLLDSFSPEFRFETHHDLAKIWLTKLDYSNIKITTENQFGFSISAEKILKEKK